ncbi:MAG: 50S ribosomal protein L11 [Alphaproteobacteria bacterium]|jgi:large subunit ribosomal protein L11|nr:50S ribosomal protein L11 [Alphaproteobacteria bacterium]
MAKKELASQVKLQVPAGAANPSPPVGPALGQAGVNIMDFCKAFNDKTKDIEKNAPIPVVINVYKDRSFDFETKLPPVSFYLKKACNLKKGSGAVGKEAPVASISMDKIKEVAETKMQDMNCHSIDSAVNMVKGQCMSMGIKVEE